MLMFLFSASPGSWGKSHTSGGTLLKYIDDTTLRINDAQKALREVRHISNGPPSER